MLWESAIGGTARGVGTAGKARKARKAGTRRRGRPRTRQRGGVTHFRREQQMLEHPVHVTLRVRRGLTSLRHRRTFRQVRRALAGGKERFGMRLVEYSVQPNHLHLLVEADDRHSLSRGMQGLGVRLAKAINRALGRSGSVFAERYHARRVTDAFDLWKVLHYVLDNARRHAADYGREYPVDWLDPCSSAPFFAGWHGRAPPDRRDPATTAPQSDLLARAWRAWGLLGIGGLCKPVRRRVLPPRIGRARHAKR